MKSPDQRYLRYKQKLGVGTFKNVYLALDTDTGSEVAWNEVSLKRLPEAEVKRIRAETALLQQLNHEHIIKYYAGWITADGADVINIIIIIIILIIFY